MKESTVTCIIFGVFSAVMASMFAFKKYEGDAFLKDCAAPQTVEKVESCKRGKRYLTCTITTASGSFVTDVTDWPGAILIPGDEIYHCTSATRLRDVGTVSCKNGSC